MSARVVMHVISHTHWDREWYRPFQAFRIRLVDLIDNMLELLVRDPDFRAFHLDGQTIVLEDYLGIRPERERLFRDLVASGRILIGPWYLLNDEFLTSGEATVRNLQIGHAICDEWGANMKVGYLPDQFGNIGQMPQILKGFGIDTVVFGRGWQLTGDRKCEFTWRGPDGTEVLASFMACWYNNAQRFPEDPDEALAFTERARDNLLPHLATNQVLLMNGVDHLQAQDNLTPILAQIGARLPENQELVHSTLPDYLAAVRKALGDTELGVHEGELREDRHNQVLAGTLSSRMYLKQANDACQRLLERVAEPLATYAFLTGTSYPDAFLRYCWKRLLQNHPHDSICGCSVDETHLDMEARFREVEQVAGEHAARALRAVAASVDTSSAPEGSVPAVLVNTLPWPRTDSVTVEVDFPLSGAPGQVCIQDAAGHDVPFSLLGVTDLVRRDESPIELPRATPVRRLTLGLVAEKVPAGGVKTLYVKPSGWTERAKCKLLRDARTVENEYFRLYIEPNGSLSLVDKVTGFTYTDLLVFADNGDAGDEYTHKAPVPDKLYTTNGWSPTVSVLECGPTRVSFEIAGELPLPESSCFSGRSPGHVTCSVSSVVTVSALVPRVEIETTVVNWAKDHRLRVLFPTDLETDKVLAEGQFDVVTRPRTPSDWPSSSPTQPQQGFVAANDGHRGLCIVNEGLPEYELLDDDRATLALTLMRCVGVISSGGEAQGVVDVTHASQMLGRFTFRFGIIPHAGGFINSGAHLQAHQQRMPLRAVQTDPHPGPLADGHSFVAVEPESLLVTATKLAPDGESVVVRCFNPTDSCVEGRATLGGGLAQAWEGDLLEAPTCELKVAGSTSAVFSASPREIVTLILRPGAGAV